MVNVPKSTSHSHARLCKLESQVMKPGPAPKPTALKKLAGNPGQRPLNRREPKPAGVASCPAWLLPEAKAEWRRVFPELEKLGLATTVDQAALAGYCQCFAHWQRAEKLLADGHYSTVAKSGFAVGRPEFKVAQDALKMVVRLAQEFGFTPAARSRITTESLVNSSASDDPDLRLLG